MTGSDDGLAGRCVIVTGAARGQGAAHARALASRGARVVITDVLDDDGQRLAASLGDSARYVRLDVTSEADWATAVEEAVRSFGPVRVLVNNAGVLIRGSLEAAAMTDYDTIMNVNVKGALLGMRAVLSSMREAGGGSIVNISSNAGMLGTPNAIAYVTSKWAVRGMTKAAAAELGVRPVRLCHRKRTPGRRRLGNRLTRARAGLPHGRTTAERPAICSYRLRAPLRRIRNARYRAASMPATTGSSSTPD